MGKKLACREEVIYDLAEGFTVIGKDTKGKKIIHFFKIG